MSIFIFYLYIISTILTLIIVSGYIINFKKNKLKYLFFIRTYNIVIVSIICIINIVLAVLNQYSMINIIISIVWLIVAVLMIYLLLDYRKKKEF